MKTTAEKIRVAQALISKLHLRKQKEDLVSGFTFDRTTHFSEMREEELDNIVSYLQNEWNLQNADKTNTQRRAIISSCHNMRWYMRDDKGVLIIKNDKPQIDYARIDTYCLTHTKAKKKFNELTFEELQKVVQQFKLMAKNQLTSTLSK